MKRNKPFTTMTKIMEDYSNQHKLWSEGEKTYVSTTKLIPLVMTRLIILFSNYFSNFYLVNVQTGQCMTKYQK